MDWPDLTTKTYPLNLHRTNNKCSQHRTPQFNYWCRKSALIGIRVKYDQIMRDF